MKQLFALAVCLMFVSDLFADDWRMRKYDFNKDGLISTVEYELAGCKLNKSLWKHADKNRDSYLDKGEARKASEYIFRNRCPRNSVTAEIRG